MREIFVVDDSEIMHLLMRHTLMRMKEYEVRLMKNGQEALNAIVAFGEPSLILLDINMPVMNGLELLGKLRELDMIPRVPIVIVSTEGREEDVLRALEAGARAYLRKPFQAPQLHHVIGQVLRCAPGSSVQPAPPGP